ncbi:MAG: hypothetical protein IT566_17310 [Rhodospirillaceae bacterium]|nr:hypothetical protein [Rhodospirillaceae bacterium]
MRLLNERVDAVRDPEVKIALRELLAATIAAQAVAAAAAVGERILGDDKAREWIDVAAEYAGVVMRPIDDERPNVKIGDRAVEHVRRLSTS